MKRNASLLLALLMVLCTMGGVTVMAEGTPVITDAYIGGFPVVGEFLHAVVDGTYDGVAFEKTAYDSASKTYAVTADYQWAYGPDPDGAEDTWTKVSNGYNNALRVCKVTSAMAGNYVRCTITPKAGGASGEPTVVVFPNVIKTAEEANWKEIVQYHKDFSDGSEGIKSSMTTTVENGALKISNWAANSKFNAETGKMEGSAVVWEIDRKTTWKPDTKIKIQWDSWSDQGTVSSLQSCIENFSEQATTDTGTGRGGEYGTVEVDSTKKTTNLTRRVYEIRSSSYQAPSADGIFTSAMMLESSGRRTWIQTRNEKDSTFSGGVSAVYVDDIKILEYTIPYKMTVTSGGQTIEEIEVASGAKTVEIPIEAGKKIKSIAVNGADKTADVTGSILSVKPVYQDFTVDVIYENLQIDRLSLEKNQTNYIGTDRMEAPLCLLAYDAAGAAYDVTGLAGVTYSSSDDSVFTFTEGNKLKSTGKNGKSVITAVCGDYSASVLMIRQDLALEGQDDLAGQTFNVKTDKDVQRQAALDTTVPGHYDNDSFTVGTKVSTSDWGQWGIYNLRVYEGRVNWFDKGYRSVGAWFYDDGVSPTGLSLELQDGTMYNGNVINSDLVDDMSYGEFASYWQGATNWSCSAPKLQANLNSDSYSFNGKTVGERTVGWHQVIFSIAKDPTSQSGWSVYAYLDGVQIDTLTPTKSGTEPHFEIRALPVKQSADDSYAYIYPNRYDDFVMVGSLEVDIFGVQYQIEGSGSVKVGETAKENGKWDYVTEGESLDVTLTPDVNYEIGTVTLDDQVLTPNASGAVTLSNVTKDSVLHVTFTEKPPVAPEIAEDATYHWFKSVDDTPTVYVYSKLNNFTTNGTDVQYGIKIWVKGQEENKITLPVRQTTGFLADAVPGQAYAVKAYGDAITSDKEYVVQPYVGETDGAEDNVAFEN